MIKVETTVRTEYSFSSEVEEKIKHYANKNHLIFEDAIYDLIDQGELNLERDCYVKKEEEGTPEILYAYDIK